MVFNKHPDYTTLNQFADGELDAGRYRRVASHLAECSRCRGEVAFIRRAGELARSLETPPVPEEILDRALERRAAGERVLLPLESPGARRPQRRRVLPAIAALLTLFVAGLFVSTRLLEADRPALEIQPERPTAGATLQIQYDGGHQFGEESYLKLRARFRTASGRSWQQIAAVLERGDEDIFRGRVALPDSVVYAAFAVENLRADQVDSNNRELWEVLVHREGRPTLAALSERAADLFQRDAIGAYRTARIITELYPDAPHGWSWRWAFEQYLPAADSLREVYRARFRQLERAFSEASPRDPDQLARMAWFAYALDERASAEFWTREATRRGASSRTYYEAKVFRLRTADQTRPDQTLQELEEIWDAAAFPVPAVADAGWTSALEAGDWAAAMVWLPRYRVVRGGPAPARVLEQLVDAFDNARVLAWATANMQETLLGAPSHRPLHRSRDIQDRREQQTRQRTLATMARIAGTANRHALARELALEALPLAFETPALETIGSILLGEGDTAAAVTAYARAAADPVGPTPPASVAADARWSRELEAARAELTRYVLQSSVIRYLPPEWDGPGRAGVVAFQASCGTSLEDLNKLAGQLGETPLIVYSAYGVGATPSALRACGLEVPVRPDSAGEIARLFQARGVPALFVTDTDGRIRFENSNVEEVPRQLMALRRASTPTVAD